MWLAALRGASGRHISSDAPLSLTFVGPSSVRFEKATLHYEDANNPGAPASQATPLSLTNHVTPLRGG